MATPPPYLEADDLVRLQTNGRLAFVERVAGDSSDEEESYASDDGASASSASSASATDERGRVTRWAPGLPAVTTPRARRDATGRALISRYDDDSDAESDGNPPAPPSADAPSGDLPPDTALVSLAATGEKLVLPQVDLRPLDRSLDPGQLVTWAPGFGPQGAATAPQSGLVESVSKFVVVRRVTAITPATVEKPDPATCFEVPSSRLGFFSGIRRGDTVVRGEWVGVIDFFQEDVYVEFPNGAIACVPGHRKALRNVDRRTPDSTRPDPFSEGMYYPGQRVRSLPDVWKSIALWIRGAYSGVDEGVVKSVKVGDVGVEWVAKSMYASGHDENNHGLDEHERGVESVRFSDIALLESFRSLWWTVGDRGILLEPDEGGQQQTAPENGLGLEPEHVPSLPSFVIPEDDDGGEWEEEDEEAIHADPNGAGPSSAVELPPRLAVKNRSKRQGGRLMKAQRKARERGGASSQAGTVSDAALANTAASPEDVVQVVGTKCRVVVLWQDGTRSENIPSLNFRVNNHPDPYDFWPGEIVVKTDDEFAVEQEEGNGELPLKMSDERKGALVRVNQSDRTAIVKWQRDAESPFEEEEEVSVYELKTDDYDVSVGDTVLHVPKDSSSSENRKEWVGVITHQTMGECAVAWYGGNVSSVPVKELLYISGGDDETYETGLSTTDVESESAAAGGQGGRRAIGTATVIRAVPPDPEYHHNWGTDDEAEAGAGAERSEFDVSSVYGKSIISGLLTATETNRLRRDIQEKDMEAAIEVVVKDTSEQLEAKRFRPDGSLQRAHISKPEERVVASKMTFQVLAEIFSISMRRPEPDTPRQMPRFPPPYHQWEEFVTRVQAAYEKLIEREKKWLAERGPHGLNSREVDVEYLNLPPKAQDETTVQADMNGNADAMDQGREDEVSAGEESAREERFQMVDELNDFHSFNTPSSSSYSTGFLSVVHREWSRLRKNLPPGVVVRASEDQCDRLRAGIIGPQDTPYADVIFFFDIRLGSTYPMEPPLVWFHSHGRRLNPNLYEDGKVCLSILGTWDGDDVESWDAKTSNLLRVLLSLQALVFVEEPYYNEAGYNKQRGTDEGRINSRIYNESAYLLCVRHVIQTLRPGGVPEDCAQVAATHYRNVGPRILERCRKLSRGENMKSVGPKDGAVSSEDQTPYASAGFRKSLSQLLRPLENVLSTLSPDQRIAL